MIRRAFTLAEILIVVGIIALLAASTAPALHRFFTTSVIETAQQELTQSIRLARAQAIEGSRGNAVGIQFSLNQYTLFSGTSYVARNPAFDHILTLPNGVAMSGLSEVVFAQKTGIPTSVGTITLTHPAGGTRFVSINGAGLVYEVTIGPVTANATSDASIIQTTPTTAYGSDVQLQVYPWNIGHNRRALIRFNLANIPPGATIQSAILSLREAGTYGFTRTINAHRVTRGWDEANVSWNAPETGAYWTTAGGDYIASPTAQATLAWDGTLGWNTWDVTFDVQQFVSGTQQNYGWLLKDTIEDTSQAYWFFSSREGSSVPTLEITYSLP